MRVRMASFSALALLWRRVGFLTAGHCGIEPGTGRADSAREFTVFTQSAGTARLRIQSVHVTGIIVYPGYGRDILAPDVALLRLKAKVGVKPVVLDGNVAEANEGKVALLVGWQTSVDECACRLLVRSRAR